MPARLKLKIGDKIRLLSVPKGDVAQREREIKEGIEQPGGTTNTIELIITQQPIVEIDTIDEYGQPWFTVTIWGNGQSQQHTLAIMEDAFWELV